MSSKKSEKNDKPDKSEDRRDRSAMAQINDIEKTIKSLSTSLNKLKTKFKTKSESTKKDWSCQNRINIVFIKIFLFASSGNLKSLVKYVNQVSVLDL